MRPGGAVNAQRTAWLLFAPPALLANAVISYIEARKDVAPVVDGRSVEQH